MIRRRVAAAAVAAGLVLAGCSQGGNESTVEIGGTQGPDGKRTTGAGFDGVPDLDAVAATGLDTPWGIGFLPDGRAIVTERDSGRVLLISPPRSGDDKPGEPVVAGTLAGVVARGESGLLGVAVSPDFASDSSVFFYLTTRKDNRVVRATLTDDELGKPTPILTGIPRGDRHDGGALLFDEDDNLLVSTGEIGNGSLAQRPRSLGGKILRITRDGKPASGNPNRKSPVWSLGHRNVEGLTLDSAGNLWASEFGDAIADEINRIEKGGNYGWPLFEGPRHGRKYVAPQVTRPPQDASWAGIAYSGGGLWVAGLRGERLYRVRVDDSRASDPRPYFEGRYGRLRLVGIGIDGRLWVGTSNRDGRGRPGKSDDRILVFNP